MFSRKDDIMEAKSKNGGNGKKKQKLLQRMQSAYDFREFKKETL